MRSPASTRGRLLVATPPLGDPNFDRTVLFVLEHTDVGAVAVVLNRVATDSDDVEEALQLAALSSWRLSLAPPQRLFVGGPVAEDSLIGLARGVGRDEAGWGSITSTIGTVDLSMHPDEVAEELQTIRIFRGYAGWAPGQLDAELAAGAWMVFDADDDDLFTSEPGTLWRTVVRRQGGRLAWIADAPDDLAAN